LIEPRGLTKLGDEVGASATWHYSLNLQDPLLVGVIGARGSCSSRLVCPRAEPAKNGRRSVPGRGIFQVQLNRIDRQGQ